MSIQNPSLEPTKKRPLLSFLLTLLRFFLCDRFRELREPPMAVFRPLLPCLILLFVVPFVPSDAREFLVGGRESSWKIPHFPEDFNRWSGKMQFVVGDTLVLKYKEKADSVLQVTEENYNNCNTTNPIKQYDDGDTEIQLDRPGPFYLISGAAGHCEKGQKLAVRVLSLKHGSIRGLPPAAAPMRAPAPSRLNVLAPSTAPGGGGGCLEVGALTVAMVLGCLVGLAALV
ncbi:early nodulin-like protein 3 [Diospyros lotus]|uniref:early nodulin-like protein 3 n=1 Tax=Diospyros lotus TaxID=55363 RepID=UPI0022598DFD|nr:early nodulin-like protein 3 [Diospyros lotus]